MKSTYRGYTIEATELDFGRIFHTVTAPNGDVIDQRVIDPKYIVDRTIESARLRSEAAKIRRSKSKKPKKPVMDTFVVDGVQYELQAEYTMQWSYGTKVLDVNSIRGIKTTRYFTKTVWVNTEQGTIQVNHHRLKIEGFTPPEEQIVALDLERYRLVAERDAITHYDTGDFEVVLSDDTVTLTCADLSLTVPLAFADGQVINRETGEVLGDAEFNMDMLATKNGLVYPGYGMYFLNQSDMNAYVALDTKISEVAQEIATLYGRESDIIDAILAQYESAVAEYETALREWETVGAA